MIPIELNKNTWGIVSTVKLLYQEGRGKIYWCLKKFLIGVKIKNALGWNF